MAINDRPYYRDFGGPSSSPLLWPFAGTVPLGDWGGIRVRLHATVVIAVVLAPILMVSSLGVASAALLGVSLLVISIVHEAGHWVAARSLGVTRDQVLVSPLGVAIGQEHVESPAVQAWSALGGPLANLMTCSGAGGLLWVLAPSSVPWNPLSAGLVNRSTALGFGELALWWLFVVSYAVLLINLLPVYAFDGSHVLHAALRPRYGFVNALRHTCAVGVFGAITLLIFGVVGRHSLLVFLALGCAINCLLQVRGLRHGADEPGDGVDYSAAYECPAIPRRRRISKSAIRKVRKAALELRLEQERLDAILAKVSKLSLSSLTWQERRALRKATERRRRQDV